MLNSKFRWILILIINIILLSVSIVQGDVNDEINKAINQNKSNYQSLLSKKQALEEFFQEYNYNDLYLTNIISNKAVNGEFRVLVNFEINETIYMQFIKSLINILGEISIQFVMFDFFPDVATEISEFQLNGRAVFNPYKYNVKGYETSGGLLGYPFSRSNPNIYLFIIPLSSSKFVAFTLEEEIYYHFRRLYISWLVSSANTLDTRCDFSTKVALNILNNGQLIVSESKKIEISPIIHFQENTISIRPLFIVNFNPSLYGEYEVFQKLLVTFNIDPAKISTNNNNSSSKANNYSLSTKFSNIIPAYDYCSRKK